MTNLDCSVKSCTYNKMNSCCKGEIQVEGRDAQDTEETCCGSFQEKQGDSYSNEAEHPCKSTDVGCDAVTCIYNEDYKCDADSIGIAGADADCCTDTECASFRRK